MSKFLIRPRCICDLCEAGRRNDRNFEARILRIGRKYGVPNKRLLRPLLRIWDVEEGDWIYVRLPYEWS